ncbi:NAD-dependent epimerase/dehydratase family protein [Catellatospora sp. NPDC049111]|uniref:NAD-dependent epimerase/dehydratase family protein n=1 Tax=Catellatospora sp. NPDC049111 TaxID=3155271 RepID=UPI003400ACE8
MRVLVTGGAGFIGTHVTRALTAAGHDVSVLDCLHPAAHRSGTDVTDVDGIQVRRADLRDRDAVDAALTGMDAVVHQAAMVGMGVDLADLPDYVGCNDLGTAVLLAGMARHRVRRLVLASSMVVYGEGRYLCAEHGQSRPAPRRAEDLAAGRFEPRCERCGRTVDAGTVDEDDRLEPRSVYAATKLAQEHLADAWARESGAVATALRYHNVYGPGMPRDTPYSGVAAIFRSALEHGRAPQVFEDGGQRRDFVHVADVAAANLAALHALPDRKIPGLRAYNIASGDPRTVADMAVTLAAAMNGPEPQVTGAYRAGDVRHIVASPHRARDEIGFTAAVPFAAGLAEFAYAPLRA